MSNSTQGAASAAPAVTHDTTIAQADQWEAEALEAIEHVQDPAEAEQLLAKVATVAEAMRLNKVAGDRERRWRGMRLKAEARYGELLPPKRPGKRTDKGTSDKLSEVDAQAQSRARKVNAAKQADPQAFADYVDNDPAPSREGLLRKAKPQAKQTKRKLKPRQRGEATFEPGSTLAYDDDVVKWVRARVRRGWSRERIMATTKAGEDDWPGHKPIGSERDFGEIRQAIFWSEQQAQVPRQKPRESGRRLRELHAQARDGTRAKTELWDLQIAVAKAVAVLEWFDLPTVDWSEHNEMLVAEIYDDLERHVRWTDAALDVVVAHMDDLGRRRKIAILDARASDPSSTPNERDNAARLAEKLRDRSAAARLSS